MSEIYWSVAAVSAQFLAGKVTHIEVCRSPESAVINYFYAKTVAGGEGAG